MLVSRSNQLSHEAGVKRIHALPLALSHPLSHINLSRLFEHSCAVSCMKENSRSSMQEVGDESERHKSAIQQLSRTVFLDMFQPQCRDWSVRTDRVKTTDRETDRQQTE